MTLCMHVATKDALIVCSDGKEECFFVKKDGSEEFTGFLDDTVKSYFYNDVIISVSGSSIYLKDEIAIYEFDELLDKLYAKSPDKFNIRQLPTYLSHELWGSDEYDFGGNCNFLISGFSPEGKPHIYLVRGRFGEITHVTRFQDYGLIGIKSLADSILYDLTISELSTKYVLEILSFIAKTYANFNAFNFDEITDSEYSKNFDKYKSVGGKWIFYVFDFKTKKKKYVKFCADGKIRYYSKLVQNEFS